MCIRDSHETINCIKCLLNRYISADKINRVIEKLPEKIDLSIIFDNWGSEEV